MAPFCAVSLVVASTVGFAGRTSSPSLSDKHLLPSKVIPVFKDPSNSPKQAAKTREVSLAIA